MPDAKTTTPPTATSAPAKQFPIRCIECGARQVPNARLSLVNGMGGMLSAAGTLVLSNAASR